MKSYKLDKKALEELKQEVDMERVLKALKDLKIVKPEQTWQDISFYKPQAGEESSDGYKGRIGIHEILPVTETIKELIMKNVTSDDIEKQAKSEGMLTMFEDGIIKAAQGLTSLEEIFRVTRE